jgi:hypothetical protein
LPNSQTTTAIDYFYQKHWLSRVQARVSLRARRAMFDLWRHWAAEHGVSTRTLLDIGATPDVERADSNCFLPWFHEMGSELDCWSPEVIAELTKKFPFINVIPPAEHTPRGQVPVATQAYDCATSSAVLEHVGASSDQEKFIAEHGRVARSIFLTTPNRKHWLEFHTKLPLLHWLPRGAHRAALRAIGHDFWAQESNLRLVTKSELRAMAQRALGNDWKIDVRTVWALGMPSNLILLARRLEGKKSRRE